TRERRRGILGTTDAMQGLEPDARSATTHRVRSGRSWLPAARRVARPAAPLPLSASRRPIPRVRWRRGAAGGDELS
ncbi:MAG: hypothetical protein JSV80_15390, partial [Acidobacteriota bacterium]